MENQVAVLKDFEQSFREILEEVIDKLIKAAEEKAVEVK